MDGRLSESARSFKSVSAERADITSVGSNQRLDNNGRCSQENRVRVAADANR